MASIRDVAAYLCKHYPAPSDLSKARLTKLVYLADWKSAVEREQPITDITWYFNNYGPYVPSVIDAAKHDKAFRVEAKENAYGNSMDLVSLKHPNAVSYDSLTPSDTAVLDEVIEATKDMNFTEFIEFVYGTHPVVTRPRYTDLDLKALAREYRRMKGVA